MRYLIVDGYLSGTGIRDAVEGGWVPLSTLELSECLREKISAWQQRYESAFFRRFSDMVEVDRLDAEGIALGQELASEIAQTKVQYFSTANMRVLAI